MTFAELIQQIRTFSGIETDSRQVQPGMIFVIGGGRKEDHESFLQEALARGASAIVGEHTVPTGSVPFVPISDFREAAARLACEYYEHPSRRLKMLGVTGTCGKTTTTLLLESICHAAGMSTGLIGTILMRYAGKTLPSKNTTPGPVELQRTLAEMVRAGVSTVVMEVSSHAIKQKRVDGVLFDAAIFTNFSLEHLDFHGTMEDYFDTKALLFTDFARAARANGKSFQAVINADDEHGRILFDRVSGELQSDCRTFRTSTHLANGQLRISADGIHGEVDGIEINSTMLGKFNAENIVAAASLAKAINVDKQAIEAGIARFSCAPGRMESVPNKRNVRALVDYAHKPGALQVVLETIRDLKGSNRLITVVGCGGDRDRAKRPVMARLAATFSDEVWLTSDNPRTEEPNQIIQEMREGVPAEYSHRIHVQVDRRKAIQEAARQAEPGTFLLVAGRGHETYQIVNSPDRPGTAVTIHFDDREELQNALDEI